MLAADVAFAVATSADSTSAKQHHAAAKLTIV
jgi:hypothetical protein